MAHRSVLVREFCVQAHEIICERFLRGESFYSILRGMTSDSLRKLCAFHCCLVPRSPLKQDLVVILTRVYKDLQARYGELVNSKNYNIRLAREQQSL